MKFRDYFSWKNLIFSVVLMTLMILFAVRQSNNTVKVSFLEEQLNVSSNKYSMSIMYSDIRSAELTALPEPGERLADAYDDDILRAGVWQNETWGEYIIVADLDATNCIKMDLNDGRTLVFSRKNNEATEKDFAELQNFLK